MSKVLTFTDGSTLDVTDASTVYDVVCVFATSAEMASAWDMFTEASLVSVKLGDEEFSNLLPVSMNAEKDENGNITVHYINRDKTDIELLQDEQEIQNDAIDALIMG